MGDKQKNKSMVSAFGTGKPPVATVRRHGETKQGQRNRGQGSDNSDIDAIFKGIQGTRGMVRRNLDGSIENPNKPQGLDALYAKNPHLRGANERQQQYDQQRKDNFLPNVQSSIDAVKQQKGYTDAQGKFVPPTMTNEPFTPYGSGSVRWLPAGQTTRGTMPDPLTGKPVFMDEFLTAQEKIQESKYGPGVRSYGQGVEKLPSKNKSFLPGQSSPPGGASNGRVGPSQAPGEPGGETLFGQMPDYTSQGMPMNYNRELGYGPNSGPQPDWNTAMGYMPNSGPQLIPYQPMMYDYIYPGMNFPASGTLLDKERARRAQPQGLVPQVGNMIEQGAQGMQDALGDFLRYLFGEPTPPQIAPEYR